MSIVPISQRGTDSNQKGPSCLQSFSHLPRCLLRTSNMTTSFGNVFVRTLPSSRSSMESLWQRYFKTILSCQWFLLIVLIVPLCRNHSTSLAFTAGATVVWWVEVSVWVLKIVIFDFLKKMGKVVIQERTLKLFVFVLTKKVHLLKLFATLEITAPICCHNYSSLLQLFQNKVIMHYDSINNFRWFFSES